VLSFLSGIFYVLLSAAIAFAASRQKKIPIVAAFLICLVLTPIFGGVLLFCFRDRHTLTCPNCGNDKSETNKCGVCGTEILTLSITKET
jgi:hypothetical protein